MRATTFKVNVTPPMGLHLCGGYLPPANKLIADNHLRGLILEDNGQLYVIAGIDYCYLIGKSHTRLENALALGASTPVANVTINANHAHAAPMITEEAHETLRNFNPKLNFHNETYFADVLARTTQAIKDALHAGLWTVSSIGFASHAVEEFASTRRVFLQPGQPCSVRWSITHDPAVKAAPIGLVDPNVDLVTLYDDADKPRASLGYFACHPQVGYVDGVIHSDTTGIALSLFEQRYPETFPIFFDGCGGDVTAGKYTSKHPTRNNHLFGVRLYDALEEAFLKSRPNPVGKFTWNNQSFLAPLAPVQFTMQEIMAKMADPKSSDSEKILAAFKKHRLDTNTNAYPFRITHARFGDIGLLMLPSELSVIYQFYAKELHRGPLAVAAYGDSYLNYVAYDKAFQEGGYEVDPWWTEVAPGIEVWIKDKIAKVIA
jgi:hypothetical protein